MTTEKYNKRIKGSKLSVTRVKSNDMKLLKDDVQCIHRNRLDRWRPLAKKYGFTDLIDKAEKILDKQGNPTDTGQFNLILQEVKQRVYEESNEQDVIPRA